MTLRCYIIENEEHAIDLLTSYIAKTPGLELIGSDLDPLEALQKINTKVIAPDLIFLDIHMPQLSGLDLAGLIKGNAHIIFTTAHSKFAVKAYETDVKDFLLKPITYERFLKGVQKVWDIVSPAVSKGETVGDHVFIQAEVKGKKVRINFADIFAVESAQNYVRFILEDQSYLTYITLKEMEDTLPPSIFIRIHKSFIINLNKVAFVEGGMIHLIDKTAYTLSPMYKKDFSDRIDENLVKRKR